MELIHPKTIVIFTHKRGHGQGTTEATQRLGHIPWSETLERFYGVSQCGNVYDLQAPGNTGKHVFGE